MVLLKKLGTVFSFTEKNLFSARVDFSVLGHVINSALIDSPAVVLLGMLSYFLCGVTNRVRILNKRLSVESFSQKNLK